MIIKKIIKKLYKKWVFNRINGSLAGSDNFERKRKMLIKCGYSIGVGTKIVGPIFISANLKIGNNCWIGRNFEAQGNGDVVVGNNCDIAPNVIVNTGSHVCGNSIRRAGDGVNCTITINDGCWIGVRSTIICNAKTKKTTIHSSSIIAASSLVKDDVSPNSLVGGVPARFIKKLS